MGYEEQLSTHSKSKKPTKHGKKIVKKVIPKVPAGSREQKQHRRRRRNFSPEYRRQKTTPLYHSDEYKPCFSEQDETNENYACFITKNMVQEMYEEEINSQKDVISKLANINL